MPSGPFSACAWPDPLRRLLVLAACGILFCLPVASAVANLWLGAGLLAWVALRCRPRSSGRISWPPLLWAWLWLLAACALSFINTAYPLESARGLIKWLKAFGVFAVTVEAARHTDGPRWLLRAAWAAVALTAADGLWQYAAGRDLLRAEPPHIALGSFPRITAGLQDPNNLGMFFGLLLPLCYLAARRLASLPHRPLAWGVVGLGAWALFFTFSRGAILGLLAAVALVVILRRDGWLASATGIALAVAWWRLPRAASDWVAHASSPLVALTNADRLQMWQAAWRMIQAHPVLGVGVGTFHLRYAEFKLPDDPLLASYAHNTYLQVWATMGLVGLLAFLALCWGGWRLWRSSRTTDVTRQVVGLGCLAGALAFLTSGLLESNLFFSKLSMLFWLVSGAAVGAATPPGEPG